MKERILKLILELNKQKATEDYYKGDTTRIDKLKKAVEALTELAIYDELFCNVDWFEIHFHDGEIIYRED